MTPTDLDEAAKIFAEHDLVPVPREDLAALQRDAIAARIGAELLAEMRRVAQAVVRDELTEMFDAGLPVATSNVPEITQARAARVAKKLGFGGTR